ncbi:MAG: NUDIX hydrolase [Maribacter sp.]|nr:NUDIX hydrolase [Maribacter sp.]
MIIKKVAYRPNKKANPLIGFLLFLISLVLFIVTGPFGFLYGVLHGLFTKGVKGVGEYLLKIAISIDQLGNVLMQHLLNVLWEKKGGYKFGNRDETISSALGRNNQLGTLTGFGKVIDKILDLIDPNHSLNSIDYYIEPSDQIVDHLAWVHIVAGQILSVRYAGAEKYVIPYIKRVTGITDAEALFREMKKSLGVELLLPTLKFIGVFEAQADAHAPGVLTRMTYYTGNCQGKLEPSPPIEAMVWLHYADRDMVSEVDKRIFDFLKDRGMLV